MWAGGRWRGTAARWSSGAVSHRTPGIASRNLRTTPKVMGHLRTVLAKSLTAWGRVNSQISIYLSTHVVKSPGKSHPRWTLSNRVALTTSVRCNRAELPKSVGPNDNLRHTASLIANTHRAGSMVETTDNELEHLKIGGFIYNGAGKHKEQS